MWRQGKLKRNVHLITRCDLRFTLMPGAEPVQHPKTGQTGDHRSPEKSRPTKGFDGEAGDRPGECARQTEKTGEECVLRGGEALPGQPQQEDPECAHTEAGRRQLKRQRGKHQPAGAGVLGDDQVPDVGENLQETEYPQRSPQTQPVAGQPSGEGSEQGGDQSEQTQPQTPVRCGIAHIEQKRSQQRLREVVGKLVKNDKGQDFERPRAGQAVHEGRPDRLPKRAGPGQVAWFGGGTPGDRQQRDPEQGQYKLHAAPAPAAGGPDRECARDQHRRAVERCPQTDGNTVLGSGQDIHHVGVNRDVV